MTHPLKPLKRLVEGPGAYGLNISSDEYSNEGVRFLRTTDISDDGTINDATDAKYIPPATAIGYLLEDGDVLFSRSGTVGRAFRYSASDHETSAYAGYLVRFRPLKSRLDSRFFFFASRSSVFQGQIEADAIQTTIVNYNAEKYGNTLLPTPPLATQRAIADFLDHKTAAIDDLIAKKKRLIELLEEKRAALINQAVTKGLDPNVPMKDSGIPWIGEIPAHWDLPPLYARYQVQLGKMLDSAKQTGEWSAPYLRNADIHWDEVNTIGLKSMDFTPSDRAKFRLQPGDIMMCEGGANAQVVGRCAVWNGELEDCYYQKALHRIRATRAQDVPRFLFYTFWAASEMGEFVADSNANIYHITAEKLRVMRFPFPPTDEQRAIVERLDVELHRIREIERLLESQAEKLVEYRHSLITAAVTGQLDIEAAEGEAA